EDPARCFRVARNAADWLEERGDCGRALRPLAYFAEDAVVVYPQAAGTPLSDYARRRVDEVAPWFERAGAVLRNLHQMPVELLGPLGPPHDFAAEIRLIAKKSEHILALVPEVASAIEALLNSARELAERLPQEPPTFTHGDLKSAHLGCAWPDHTDGFRSFSFSRPVARFGVFFGRLAVLECHLSRWIRKDAGKFPRGLLARRAERALDARSSIRSHRVGQMRCSSGPTLRARLGAPYRRAG